MKAFKVLFEVFIRIINTFYIPFVLYLVYTWYSPEVGFELPDLSYIEVFAISWLVNIFLSSPDTMMLLINQDHITTKDKYLSLQKTLIYSITLLFSWIVYIILF